MQEDPTDATAPTEVTAGVPPERTSRRNVLLAALPALAVAAVGAFAVLVPSEPPPPSTTTTITSTPTTAPTTTTVPVLPAGTVEVATAKPQVKVLRVRSSPPPDWESTPLSIRSSDAAVPPSSEGESPERPPLPRPDLPVTGRFARDGGWEFDNPGPYQPTQPFTMLVAERRGRWLEVHVPVRPNSTRGWVAADDVDLSRVSHRIEVRLGERSLRAWDGDRLLAETPVAVGTDATRTPTGVFYVTDVVPQPNPRGAYGPVALATDGYSEMMDQFSTGVPVIALHGTNRPAGLGRAVSNGCIRMPNEIVEQLAATLPRGTPVLIWP